MNSRNKGKRGELEACRFWCDEGFPARRQLQGRGGHDVPDIVIDGLEEYACEVKRRERFGGADLDEWLAKATRDATYRTPFVMHRRNGERWKVTLWAEDFAALVRETS